MNKKSSSENERLNDIWERITKNYEYIEGAQISNSFIILLVLNESKEPLTTTQISEKIALNSKGKIFKISGTFKDSLEIRLRKAGYVDGTDIPNIKRDRKPIRMTLYSITPKGQKLLKGWLAFLSAL